MFKKFNRSLAAVSASYATGIIASREAYAEGGFNDIAGNIVDSISNFPTLISAVSYLFGMLLMVLGVMKIKDHVENPTQEPLKNGAIRLAAGGGLFALPILSEAALATVGEGTSVTQGELEALTFE